MKPVKVLPPSKSLPAVLRKIPGYGGKEPRVQCFPAAPVPVVKVSK